MPDEPTGSEMAKEGGDPPAVTVNIVPVVAWVWRRGWLQTLWRKARGK